MSTLVVLGVVLLAVVGVLHLALSQAEPPDRSNQPATARPQPVRGEPAPEPVAVAVAAEDTMLEPVLVDISIPATTRVRSAVTLMMLVAVLGAGVAILVAAVVVGAARVVSGGGGPA